MFPEHSLWFCINFCYFLSAKSFIFYNKVHLKYYYKVDKLYFVCDIFQKLEHLANER
jgi:hypothetical protein